MYTQLLHVFFLSVYFLFVTGCAGLLPETKKQVGYSLNLIHLNDTHSHLDPSRVKITLGPEEDVVRLETGGVERLMQRISEIRRRYPRSLFLHAGDLVQGTPYYSLFDGKADLEFFEEMGLDVMVTGNHEYDRGAEALAMLVKQAEFPILAANLDASNDPHLKGLIPAFFIKQLGGEKIGIIGIVTKDVPLVSSPGESLDFLDTVETAQHYIDTLTALGINKIILLTHLGYENDVKLAQSLQGVDVIVGGHSHSLLGDFDQIGLEPVGKYPTVVENETDTVLVVQSWHSGKVLGFLQVDFDQSGHVLSYVGKPMMVSGPPFRDKQRRVMKDQKLAEVLELMEGQPLIRVTGKNTKASRVLSRYKEEVKKYDEKVVGQALSDLMNIRIPSGAYPGGSMVAPLVSQSMLWKARSIGIEADFSIQNAGGVRIDIAAGDITLAEVYSLLPFSNSLVTLQVTGRQVKEILESSLSYIFDQGGSTGAFPYCAALRYKAKKERLQGQRIYSMEVLLEDGSWFPVEPDRMYTVAINSFIAQGKDGYHGFATVPEKNDTGFVDTDIFIEYLEHMGSINKQERVVWFE